MTEGQTQSKQSQELYAQDGELNIVFNNNDQRIKSITILTMTLKQRVKTKMNILASYGIAGNGDGTYDLEFVVDENSETDYIYDGDRKRMKFTLRKTTMPHKQILYKPLQKKKMKILNIEFVNIFINRYSETQEKTNTYS